MIYTLTERTKELLRILTKYSNNTKYTWIILNIVTLILMSSLINEKLGGTKPRIAARSWNLTMPTIDSMMNPVKFNSNKKNKAINDVLSKNTINVDKQELETLISYQLTEFESVKIPLIGVSISARDTSFVGALALLIIYLWYLLSITKERSVLAQLIYPLTATSKDETAQKLWGERDESGEIKTKSLEEKISLYRKEIVHMKESISSKFLTLYSNSKKRLFEFFIIGVLTFMPLILLTASTASDIYWDFGKQFKETNTTFYCEIDEYQKEALEFSKHLEKEGLKDLSEKFVLASKQLKAFKRTLIVKRIISVIIIIIIILSGICVYDLRVAQSMTNILTDMNKDPKKLNIEKYVDA